MFGRVAPYSILVLLMVITLLIASSNYSYCSVDTRKTPRRILVDTDVDHDDVLALLYLLKQNNSEFQLQAITINANAWSDAGHAVNHLYDILFMMGRDDIPIGVGGEGGITPYSTILPNVGGYLPVIDQRMSTAGGCRYRQSIPVGHRGRLEVNSNYGLRRGFLPQGDRKYTPFGQPTAQQVMKDAVSAGPITVFLLGSHTNLAIFLMSNPHLVKNIVHVYAMGGAVRPKCSIVNSTNTSSKAEQCSRLGSLWPPDSNTYAEYNIFADPFGAYKVLHSGIPVTLVPLDATNTIPVSRNFFSELEKRQNTYEAQYCFKTLKMAQETWFGDGFFQIYSTWDEFMVSVALSEMQNGPGKNEFTKMKYMNITVVTSNEPYGISDGSNPLVNGCSALKFGVKKNGVHTGHVQMGMRDPFCIAVNSTGKCQDGYTKEVMGSEGVQVLVATEAKPSLNGSSSLDKAFYESFLDIINQQEKSGKFSIETQFPYYREIYYKPNLTTKSMGKPFVFDMDMSAGDLLALLYLLKLPVETANLKGILISSNGWATAATIDVVYDILHMMGRDDIPVGLGEFFATGQQNPSFNNIGDCKYIKAIPHGSGGFLDSDTVYGLARDLPRSPRRYTAENSVKFGAPRDTDHPELRQPTALECWNSIVKSLNPEEKITLLTNGPLTNLAQILNSRTTNSFIRDVYIVGGHIKEGVHEKGNIFTVPSNEFGEFNIFLDPLAAKTVLDSEVSVTLIPLHIQRKISSFPTILDKLRLANQTPESRFSERLICRLWQLKRTQHQYHHVDMFLGEIIGAVISTGNDSYLQQKFQTKPIKVVAEGNESKVGEMVVDEKEGKLVKILKNVDSKAYYEHFATVLGDTRQSALIASFDEQKILWGTPPNIRKYK